MTARPADAAWQPLGWDTDPVPGDPGRIDTEAQHLSKIAGQIADQVSKLKAIAAQGTEVGKHAEKIRTSAGTLAGKLDTVGTRYNKVSSALSAWSPQLSHAQSMSLQALNQAEAPYKQLSTPAAPPSGHLTASQQQQAVTDYNNAMTKAQGQLEAALALLGRATSLRDSEGSQCASAINKACDDALTDSFWDKFKDFVDKWAWLINDVCTALEVLAAIAAIVALCVSGAGLILLFTAIAMSLTGLALIGRIMLASTGNGSWLAVGLDAASLLSLGLGSYIGTGLEATFSAAKGVATTLRLAEITDSAGGQIATKIAEFASGLKDTAAVKGMAAVLKLVKLPEAADGLTAGLAKAGETVTEKMESVMSDKASGSVTKLIEKVSTETKPLETFWRNLPKKDLVLSRQMTALVTRFGGDEKFDDLAARFATQLNISRVAHGLGVAANVAAIGSGISWDAPSGKEVLDISPAPALWHWVRSEW